MRSVGVIIDVESGPGKSLSWNSGGMDVYMPDSGCPGDRGQLYQANIGFGLIVTHLFVTADVTASDFRCNPLCLPLTLILWSASSFMIFASSL